MDENSIFRIIVYLISIFFIFHKSVNLKIVGFIILISHLYKDYTNMTSWPLWCDFIGILLGIIIVRESLIFKNSFIMIMGIAKILAHSRQILFNNNKYYFP